MGNHFLANFTIEKIGNEAGPLLKCVDVNKTSVYILSDS